MVKTKDITDKSKKEKEQVMKVKSLIEETFENIKISRLYNFYVYFNTNPYFDFLVVDPYEHRITLHDPLYFDQAKKFAELYETNLGIEPTLQLDYSNIGNYQNEPSPQTTSKKQSKLLKLINSIFPHKN